MEIVKAIIIGPLILGLFFLSLIGTLCVRMPQVGCPLIGVLAAAAYVGLRLWRDPRRGKWVRRLSLAGGVFFGLTALGGAGYAFVERDYQRFQDWHAGGGGVRAGMSLEEARKQLAAKSAVTDLHDGDLKGVRFQVEPVGLAAWRWEFPLNELYYIDAQADAAGRIVSVKSWHD